AMNDPYYTDGRRAVLELADVPVLPLGIQVRGPLAARTTKALGRALRWRLPKRGRDRAKQGNQRQEATSVGIPPTSRDQRD
ncbi:MAG: hypothetical protein ACRDHP_13245, partial [Ktedonobacterales bacterium]